MQWYQTVLQYLNDYYMKFATFGINTNSGVVQWELLDLQFPMGCFPMGHRS